MCFRIPRESFYALSDLLLNILVRDALKASQYSGELVASEVLLGIKLQIFYCVMVDGDVILQFMISLVSCVNCRLLGRSAEKSSDYSSKKGTNVYLGTAYAII